MNQFTVKLTVVEWLNAPLVPVIVSVLVPVGVFLAVDTVIVDVPEPVTELGLKLAFEREGSPLTLRLTTPLNPPETATVTVVLVLDPRLTLRELGEAEIEKLALETTRVTVVECINVPLVPVTVTV